MTQVPEFGHLAVTNPCEERLHDDNVLKTSG